MFNYGTLQSMVEALLEHNKKVLEFEKGMEKLLGPDSTVMSTWMSDAPYEMLKTLIMAEGGETEDGWNWFEEHLDDFMKGTGSKIAIKEDSDKGGWKEYEVKTLHDPIQNIHSGLLKPSRFSLRHFCFPRQIS